MCKVNYVKMADSPLYYARETGKVRISFLVRETESVSYKQNLLVSLYQEA